MGMKYKNSNNSTHQKPDHDSGCLTWDKAHLQPDSAKNHYTQPLTTAKGSLLFVEAKIGPKLLALRQSALSEKLYNSLRPNLPTSPNPCSTADPTGETGMSKPTSQIPASYSTTAAHSDSNIPIRPPPIRRRGTYMKHSKIILLQCQIFFFFFLNFSPTSPLKPNY